MFKKERVKLYLKNFKHVLSTGNKSRINTLHAG